tara:strand:- start:3747 stop:4646 length:900 start_codon:yes stop_codon:yes gene_type:complete
MYKLVKKKILNYLTICQIIFICQNSFSKEFNYYLELNTIYDGAVATNFSNTSKSPLSDIGINITHGMDVYINKNINLNFELAEENYDKVKDGDNKFKIITAEFSNQYNDIDNIIFVSNMDLKLPKDELSANLIAHNASFFLKGLFININNTFTRKKLKNNADLNGNNIIRSLSSYYFFNEAKTFINFSLKKTEEKINNNKSFDFNELSLTSSLQHKFLFKNIKCKTQLGYSLHLKDYINNSNDKLKTYENIKKIKSSLEVELNQNISTELLYEHQNRQSNIETYTYRINKVIASIKYNF